MQDSLPSIDEGSRESNAVPSAFANGGAPRNARKRTVNSNMMSVVSQQYDIGNKGYLDETERTMREMDKEGLGHLSNDAVYKMMVEQMKMQQKVFNLKRIVIGLSMFTVLLAITNLGTAWAAAVLARETSIDNSSTSEGAAVMMTKDGTRPVGVRPVGAHYEATDDVTEEGRRILRRALQTHRGRDLLDDYDTEGVEGAFSISKGNARAMYNDCLANSPSRIIFGCPNSDIAVPICGSGEEADRSSPEGDSGEETVRVFMFGQSVTIACPYGGDDVMCSCSMGRPCPRIFMPRPGSGMMGPQSLRGGN